MNTIKEKYSRLGVEKPHDKELQSMMRGGKSKLVDLKVAGKKIPAFLSAYKKKDGSVDLKVHPKRSQVKNDFNLSDQNLEKLNKGRLVVHKDKVFQKDRQTGELLHVEKSKINIPDKLENQKLTASQKKDLLEGKRIEVNGKRIGVDLNDSKGYSATVPLKDGVKNEHSIRR